MSACREENAPSYRGSHARKDTRARLCHPPTSARAPRCHRRQGDTQARAAGRGGKDAPGIRRSVGTAPHRNGLYRSEQQWEEERDVSSKILYQTIAMWGSRKSCVSHQVGFEGYFLPQISLAILCMRVIFLSRKELPSQLYK